MNLYALFFGLALFGFCSCDNDDSVTPDPQARQAFESKYPNATQVEWEKKNNYLIAEFIDIWINYLRSLLMLIHR